MKYFNILFLILFLTTSAKAQSVKVSVSKVSIPTYTEPEREELPMFAETGYTSVRVAILILIKSF